MTRSAATILISLALLGPLAALFIARLRQRSFGALASDVDRLIWWTGLAAACGMLVSFVVSLSERPPDINLLAMVLWGGVFVGVPMAAFQAFGTGSERLVRRLGGPTWLDAWIAFVSAFPALYVGMAVVLELLWITTGLSRGFGPHRVPFFNFTSGNHAFALTIAGIAGAVRLASDLRAHATEREVERLRAETTAARLGHLEARLRPHFLYNALSGLVGLIREDPERAEAMTLALARLLQRSLDGADAAPTLPLRAELDLVRDYLAVEQQRFGDRLRVTVEAAPEAMDAEVPRLTLQPLVENAIKHGLGKTGQAVHILVTGATNGSELHLLVSDDGPAFPPDLTGGHGLTSVTERLRLLYGEAFTLRFENPDPPDTVKRIRIVLPYRMASPLP